jgi:hypothetical protein
MRWLTSILLCTISFCAVAVAARPVVYSTDLYHPHNDPDDHYDLLTLFSLPELDVRAVIFDMGNPGKGRPDLGGIAQMCALRGKQTPVATGLIGNLTSPEDRALDRASEEQAGVELILKSLRDASTPVTLFAVGSLRDMAVAFNRAPELFKEKVNRFYINAGDTRGKIEYNVGLDPIAYNRIMTSGLPIYWTPCFGDGGYGSFWQFRQNDVLSIAPGPLQNFFLYMFSKSSDPDALGYLKRKPDAVLLARVSGEDRAMWCTAAFLDAADRTDPTFCYRTEGVMLKSDGTTLLVNDAPLKLKTIYINQPQAYPVAMMRALRQCAEMPGMP